MVLILIIASILLGVCIYFAFVSFRDGEDSSAAWAVIIGVINAAVIWLDAGAMLHGNRHTVEYRFPASEYSLTEEVRSPGDTVYVLVGEEPMVIEKIKLERRVRDDE